jgi:L-arabinose transport system substrate-binding protein
MRDRMPSIATRRRMDPIALGGALVLLIGPSVAGATDTSPAPSAPAMGAEASPVPAASGGTKPLLVAINRGATQQYFIDLQSAFTQEVERLGGTAKTYDAQEDPSLTLSLVNDAVSAGAKGIAVSAQNSDLGPAMSEITQAAGVALVATDSTQVDGAGDPIPFVGFDGTAMGDAVGQEVVRQLEAVGWLGDPAKKVGVLSVEAQTIAVCEQRTDESKRLLIGSGFPAEQIYQVPYGGDTSTAQEATGPVVTAHPDVTNWVIFSCNDEGVLGALNALGTAGADPADILGVGIGAYEACKYWAAGLPSGFTAALFISGLDVGKAAADVLWDKVVNGVALPERTIAETTMVDSTNYTSTLDPVSLENCSS